MSHVATERPRVVHDLDSLALPPMPPKILEAYKRMWTDPEWDAHLEVGDEGLWVAMFGGEIVATDPSHDVVLRLVGNYGPEDILMLHLPPDDVIEIY